jgi:gas vesicle protein
MGQDPDAIRREIENTRERMGETVDALAYKADVPARAKETVTDRVDRVRSKLTGAGSQVAHAAPGTDDLRNAGHTAVGVAQENPLGLAIGAAAVGFIAGILAPSTRVEDERLGPIADELREQAKQTGQEAIERGTEVAQEVAQAAVQKAQEAAAEVRDVAQDAAQHHAQELQASAQESAETVRSAAGS